MRRIIGRFHAWLRSPHATPDEPGFSSPEFMFGASGAGHVFLRLWQPDAVRLPLV